MGYFAGLNTVSLNYVVCFFQHVMGLQPCVMCIYQRVAILGIMAGAAIGFINPKNFSLRWVAYLMGLFFRTGFAASPAPHGHSASSVSI